MISEAKEIGCEKGQRRLDFLGTNRKARPTSVALYKTSLEAEELSDSEAYTCLSSAF